MVFLLFSLNSALSFSLPLIWSENERLKRKIEVFLAIPLSPFPSSKTTYNVQTNKHSDYAQLPAKFKTTVDIKMTFKQLDIRTLGLNKQVFSKAERHGTVLSQFSRLEGFIISFTTAHHNHK